MSADLGAYRRCGVLGSPIEHSLSPVLHQAAYRELGLDWDYTAHDVTREQLGAFWRQLTPPWRGLSLTMPLKRDVIGFCDRVEDLAALLRSVNTVVFDEAGSADGYNTDVVGMVRALKAVVVHRIDTAVIVGGGATAASALAASALLGGSSALVVARSPQRAHHLRELGPALNLEVSLTAFDDALAATRADVVISTIPAAGQEAVASVVSALAPVVFDVVYHPPESALVRAARSAGRTVVPGFELLLHQAARQVELMTGARTAPVEAMRAAGLAAMRDR